MTNTERRQWGILQARRGTWQSPLRALQNLEHPQSVFTVTGEEMTQFSGRRVDIVRSIKRTLEGTRVGDRGGWGWKLGSQMQNHSVRQAALSLRKWWSRDGEAGRNDGYTVDRQQALWRHALWVTCSKLAKLVHCSGSGSPNTLCNNFRKLQQIL